MYELADLRACVPSVKETETVVPEASTSETPAETPAVAFDASTKTAEKKKEKTDLAKLGRRLSARFGAALS